MSGPRRLLAAAALLLVVPTGCGRRNGPPYANNDLQLLTAYAAKEICSCVFVMGQSEEFCGRFTRANPNLNDACRQLVQTANEAGGVDNITVILVRLAPKAA